MERMVLCDVRYRHWCVQRLVHALLRLRLVPLACNLNAHTGSMKCPHWFHEMNAHAWFHVSATAPTCTPPSTLRLFALPAVPNGLFRRMIPGLA
eukprot:388869-Rhodomonas_salina.1